MLEIVGSRWCLVDSSWYMVCGGCVKNENILLINSLFSEQNNVDKILNIFKKNNNCVQNIFIQPVLQTYSKIIYTDIISFFNLLINSFYTVSTIPIINTINLNII